MVIPNSPVINRARRRMKRILLPVFKEELPAKTLVKRYINLPKARRKKRIF